MTDRADPKGWRIQSRQRRAAVVGGHNYLVLVDPSGKVREELHGWKNNEGRMSRIHVKDDEIVAGTNDKGFLKETMKKYPEIAGAEVTVPLKGREAREVWADFLKTGDRHHDVHRYNEWGDGYDLQTHERFYNSNGFWRSVLEENGYDWQDLHPNSPQITRGVRNPLPPLADRRGDADDPMSRPVETWSEADVRSVMRDDAYWSSAYPEHKNMQAKVRAWHERKYDRGGSGGGPVHVSAHMRAGAHVSDYTRARPSH